MPWKQCKFRVAMLILDKLNFKTKVLQEIKKNIS